VIHGQVPKIGCQKVVPSIHFPFPHPASPMPSPCPTPAERRSPSPRPQQQKQKQQPPAKVERPRKEAVSPATAVVFRPTHLQTAEASRGRKAHNTGMPSNSRQTTQQIGTFVPSLLSVPRKGARTAVTAVVTVHQPMPGQQQDKKEVPWKSWCAEFVGFVLLFLQKSQWAKNAAWSAGDEAI